MLCEIKGFYFITDAHLSKNGNISDVKTAQEAGVKLIQYRNKNGTTWQMYKEALELKNLIDDALFLINDRIDIAQAIDADGVHLGQEDMPYEVARKILGKDKIIGISVGDLKEAEQVERMGADYIGLGPIFSTLTKSDAGNPMGVEMIQMVKEKVSIPVVAIGGITVENAPCVIKAGADALCAISDVVSAADVRKKIQQFQSFF